MGWLPIGNSGRVLAGCALGLMMCSEAYAAEPSAADLERCARGKASACRAVAEGWLSVERPLRGLPAAAQGCALDDTDSCALLPATTDPEWTWLWSRGGPALTEGCRAGNAAPCRFLADTANHPRWWTAACVAGDKAACAELKRLGLTGSAFELESVLDTDDVARLGFIDEETLGWSMDPHGVEGAFGADVLRGRRVCRIAVTASGGRAVASLAPIAGGSCRGGASLVFVDREQGLLAEASLDSVPVVLSPSSDGQRVAMVTDRGALEVWDAGESEATYKRAAEGRGFVLLAPDGDRVALVGRANGGVGVSVLALPRGKTVQEWEVEASEVLAATWLGPDDVALATDRGLVRLALGSRKVRLQASDTWFGSLAGAPDGSRLVATSLKGAVHVLLPKGSRVRDPLVVRPLPVWEARSSVGGLRVVGKADGATEVSFVPIPVFAPGTDAVQVRVEGDGTFSAEGLVPGLWRVVARDRDGRRASFQRVRVGDEVEQLEPQRLQPSSAVSGRVTDSRGRGLVDATVMVAEIWGDDLVVVDVVRSGAGGRYELLVPDGARLSLGAWGPGGQVVRTELAPMRGGSARRDLRLRGRGSRDVAAVRLLDERGAPVPGVSFGLPGLAEVQSDDDGWIAWQVDEEVQQDLPLRWRGSTIDVLGVPGIPEERVLPTGSLEIARPDLRGDRDLRSASRVEPQLAVGSADDGHIEAGTVVHDMLSSGTWHVLSRRDDDSFAYDRVEVGAYETTRVTPSWEPAGHLTGQVLDATDGWPVAWAEVETNCILHLPGRPSLRGIGRCTTRTGVDGRFDLGGLGGERWVVRVGARGYQAQASWVDGPNTTLEVRIGPRPAGSESSVVSLRTWLRLDPAEHGVRVVEVLRPERIGDDVRVGDVIEAVNGVSLEPFAGLRFLESFVEDLGAVSSPVHLRIDRGGRQVDVSLGTP